VAELEAKMKRTRLGGLDEAWESLAARTNDAELPEIAADKASD